MPGPVVAHLVEKYPTSGERYIYEQVELPTAVEGIVLTDRLLRSPVDPGLPVRARRTSSSRPLVERVRARLERTLPAVAELPLNRFVEREARRAGADLLHAHFGMMAAKVLPARRRTGLPMVVTFYGVDASHCVESPYWRPRLTAMFPEAERVVVLCEEAGERLVGIGCPPDKVVLWDIGIPLDEYPYRAPAVTDAVRFLCVARFVEKKGHAYLLDAFAAVRARLPEARLTLMGNGHLRAELEARIAAPDLAGAVELVDTTDMPDFFERFRAALDVHDIFVLPSVVARDGDDEGGPPVVITNAMAVGLPVIATPVGGIGRAIVDGVSGVLCPPREVEPLVEAMVALASDPVRCRTLSEGGRRMAEERFDLRRQIERLQDLYLEVLA